MKKILLIVLMIFPFISNADIYVWDDQQGNAHFSDVPEPSAKLLQVTTTQTYTVPILPAASKPVVTKKVKPVYESLHIAQPVDKETIVNNKQGDITVKISVHPGLQINHRLQLVIDKKIVATHKQLVFNLKHLERGTHVLQAQVVDAQNRVLRESSVITIYVQRSKVMRKSS